MEGELERERNTRHTGHERLLHLFENFVSCAEIRKEEQVLAGASRLSNFRDSKFVDGYYPPPLLFAPEPAGGPAGAPLFYGGGDALFYGEDR